MKILILVWFFIISYFSCGQDTIQFLSKNPFSFKDIINGLDAQPPQDVYGVLKMPEKEPNKIEYPLIIAVAGSDGWSAHHYEYLKMYRSHGIATFELCSFQSRGVKSTVGTQTEVTTAMMIYDAYQAINLLAKYEKIDTKNIAITGWSLGGGVALFSAWEPLKNSINSDAQFSAYLPIYPPCIVVPKTLDFGNNPIHILIGELDEWTPADACLELLNSIPNKINIDLTIYPNAHHSFDRDQPIETKENGYILTNCRFILDDHGSVLMNLWGIPMTTPFLQKVGLALCAKRGPKYGGNPVAKRSAMITAKDFMITHLK